MTDGYDREHGYDPEHDQWIDRVSFSNTFPLTMPAVLHDGSMRDLHVDAGDAYIHRDTGIILSLFLSDGTGQKVGYVLKHADPSVEPFKDLLHGARDLYVLWSLIGATPVGRALKIGGFVLRHLISANQKPKDAGYYQYPEGGLAIRGIYRLSAD